MSKAALETEWLSDMHQAMQQLEGDASDITMRLH